MAIVEAKVMIIYLLKNYRILPTKEEMIMQLRFVYEPKNKDFVRFIKL
jgi:hypothetical protein